MLNDIVRLFGSVFRARQSLPLEDFELCHQLYVLQRSDRRRADHLSRIILRVWTKPAASSRHQYTPEATVRPPSLRPAQEVVCGPAASSRSTRLRTTRPPPSQ